jgi:hypothetical protein
MTPTWVPFDFDTPTAVTPPSERAAAARLNTSERVSWPSPLKEVSAVAVATTVTLPIDTASAASPAASLIFRTPLPWTRISKRRGRRRKGRSPLVDPNGPPAARLDPEIAAETLPAPCSDPPRRARRNDGIIVPSFHHRHRRSPT